MTKIYLIIAILLSSQMLAQSHNLGYFTSHKKLIADYTIIQEDADASLFADYILQHAKGISVEESKEIAEEVINSSKCFSVEPRVLLALIRLESLYNVSAISPTGAVGLTQFTSIAAQEIADQLGRRGRQYANPKNTQYIKEVLSRCVDEDWINIWDRTGTDNWKKNKSLFLRDIRLSVTYGAILFKIYLANNAVNEDLEGVYHDALADYNGEAGQRKYWYAKTILGYFNEMNF